MCKPKKILTVIEQFLSVVMTCHDCYEHFNFFIQLELYLNFQVSLEEANWLTLRNTDLNARFEKMFI